jgi:hypothetical protein
VRRVNSGVEAVEKPFLDHQNPPRWRILFFGVSNHFAIVGRSLYRSSTVVGIFTADTTACGVFSGRNSAYAAIFP